MSGCPLMKEAKQRMKKKHYAHVVEDDEPVRKKERREDSYDEYVCIVALTRSVNYGNDTWLIDSDATKQMTGYKESLSNLVMKESPHNMRLGDDSLCSIKGKGSTSYNLISGKRLKMENVLYMPGLRARIERI